MAPEDLVQNFFNAIERHDRALLERIYDDDVEVWFNGSDSPIGKVAHIDELLALGALRRRSYPVLEQFIVGDRVVRRYVAIIELMSGERFEIPIAIFVTVRNGRIVRIDEYVDSLAVQAVRSAAAQISSATL